MPKYRGPSQLNMIKNAEAFYEMIGFPEEKLILALDAEKRKEKLAKEKKKLKPN